MKNIEEMLTSAAAHAAPDVLENILSECDTGKGRVIYMEKRKNNTLKVLSAVAAVFVLLVAGFFMGKGIDPADPIAFDDTLAAVVSLDVNPSVELKINPAEKVISASGLNEDGVKILGYMKLEGTDLNVAVNAVVGSMLKQGFIDEMANSILGAEGSLEFANTKIRCPRCKMTLREFETSGQAGCIECFNTFNETILKHILKRQGSSEYKGRNPGEISSIDVEDSAVEDVSSETVVDKSVFDTSAPKAEAKAPEAPKAPNNDIDTSDLMSKESLDEYSNEVLEAAMKKAASEENYPLAMRLRDELKKRKEGN